MHQNQQVILSLLFYQVCHEGRIYSLPKVQKSRRVTVSRPVCVDLNPNPKRNGVKEKHELKKKGLFSEFDLSFVWV